jgi:hypothetical protein
MSDEDHRDEPAAITAPVKGNGNLRPPWQKGQSGNPLGRPKKAINVAEIARDSSEKAIARLAKLIDSEDESIAVRAATEILDRAIGRPKQSLETTTKKETSDYTTAELIEIAGVGRARVATSPTGEREIDTIQ